MTGAARELRRAWAWLGEHDPGYGATRRALRAAIVMPSVFAFTFEVIGNAQLATFGVFGTIAMLLLAEFRGPRRSRMQSQAALAIVGAAMVCIGTIASRSDVAAVAAMTVFGVLVVFSGVVSSVLAAASNSLLLGFILPVSLPGPASTLPDRLAGWGIAGGAAVLAIGFLFPPPSGDPLRGASVALCGAIADRLRASTEDAAGRAGGAVREALAGLSRAFLAGPIRPTGLTTAARATVRLVDELRWLSRVVLDSDPMASGAPAMGGAAISAVRLAAAAVLARSAAVLSDPAGSGDELARARRALRSVTDALVGEVGIPRRAETTADPGSDMRALVSALDPAFRAQEASFMADQVAANVEVFAAATARSWWAQAIGREPAGIGGRLSSARERASSYLTLRSTALQNALRGGIALGGSVLAARLIGVEHAFWVSLGTLTILRSNAQNTGQTFAQALGGTVAGFVVGAAIVLAIGTDTAVLWALLPIAILFGGIAPVAISFLVGQAGFTVVLFIVFNILAPAGWQIGLVRIEDVAIGGGASLLVGLVFWPRGAGAALGAALAEAYVAASSYLARAVDEAVACCAPGMPGADLRAGAARREATAAAAASRRLDDTFRTYLAERGPKRLSLSDTTLLVGGATSLRLAGDAVLGLWQREPDSTQSRVGAARELLARAREREAWFAQLAASLAGAGPVPDPEPPDPEVDDRLLATIDHDLRSPDGAATTTAVRVVWTGDHLDAARRLESAVVGPVREAMRSGELGMPPRSRPAVGPLRRRVWA